MDLLVATRNARVATPPITAYEVATAAAQLAVPGPPGILPMGARRGTLLVATRGGAAVGQSGMLTGTEIAAQLAALPDWRKRSQFVVDLVRAGNVPDFIKTNFWRWVETKAGGRTLRFLAAPDFMSVGTNDDYLVFGPTPIEGQQIADFYNSILPSRKLSTDIFNAASRKLPLSDVKAPPENVPTSKIETIDAVLAARRIDRGRGYDPNAQLVAGHRKDIVIGPALDGAKVAIFGGNGGAYNGWAIQSYSTIHGSYYGDYSHGLRLVSRRAFLDGTEVDLATLFTDPATAALVSDQGMFVPRFPNAGPNATPLPLASGPLGGPAPGAIGGGPKAKPTPGITKVVNKPMSEGDSAILVAVAVVGVGLLVRAFS